ncbi:MAG: putative porin [Flavobacteriaceae bacterium]|nr:putative porin [Flavobacteriaceae bacterium]
MKYIFSVLALFLLNSYFVYTQTNHTNSKLVFTGDFRFRVEQDWNSQKSDGSYRDNRTRFRYRFRFGMRYQYNDWASFGMRLRTGDRQNQQDAQITLGSGFKEFSTLPIGFEKIYFKADYKWFSGWLGKNTFPFEKQNELFWSDNVFPEGIFFSAKINSNSQLLQSLKLSLGHFIINSDGTSLNKDSYFQGAQLLSIHWKNKLKFFPSFYYFKNIPNIPDGNGTYTIDYSILHFGTKIKLIEKPAIAIGLDYYQNIENLNKIDSIPQNFRDQKQGVVMALTLGKSKVKGDWTIQAYYTYLERYSAVDFLSQNDWTRWDYSNQGSPAGRLTNFKGLELRAGYVINKNFKLKMRYFIVDQIIPYGTTTETGNRIRFDLDIGF